MRNDQIKFRKHTKPPLNNLKKNIYLKSDEFESD